MAGHSKWANIKHKKAREDVKRGKIFTKLIKEISVAVRGGGSDPTGNPRLRMALDKAKTVNMPQENISRAIKKASGGLDGITYEEITYEGYGPFGTAVIVESLTDNKKRTVSDIRHAFAKYGGNLGEDGSVAWMFEHKGVIHCSGILNEDKLLEKLIEYDIDNMTLNNNVFTIICDIKNLELIKKAIEDFGMNIEDARFEWVAKNTVAVTESKQEERVFKFLEGLEALDDVQDVYTNLG
jgi:YebC/PmpR family DNA-binding regulatory protein